MNKEFSAFRRLVNFVANLDFKLTLALVALAGILVIFEGMAYEQYAQYHLLLKSGPAAVDAYRAFVASHQLTFIDFLVDSVTGRCYAISALVQGVGFWILFILTPLVACTLGVARLAAQPSLLVPRR
jgi:hypothetical protein